MPEAEPTIEEALKRLEAIADKLEDPDLDLDQAVRLYEEGLRLYERCAAADRTPRKRPTSLVTVNTLCGRRAETPQEWLEVLEELLGTVPVDHMASAGEALHGHVL